MGLQRGERQAQRTKKAIETAFSELIHEKSYNTITIGEIVDRANTGRSTFYRYFETKADVLISMHGQLFNHLSLGLTSASDWLADTPSPALIAFLTQYQRYNTPPVSLAAKLGNDMDYVMQRINGLLIHQFEDSLHHAFEEADSTIPFHLLALSIAGVYNMLLTDWFMSATPRSQTPEQLAEIIHRLARAIVQAALD